MRTLTFIITILISAINISLLAQVPVDAQHPFAEIHYSSTPQNNRWGVAWFQAATIQNNGVANNGYIVVDYIKLIEENPSNGQETVLHVEHYNGSGQLSQNEGGLFVRFPSWYYTDYHTALVNSNKSGGYVTINVGEKPNNIIHFWGVRQQCSLERRHKIEVRLKISGDIGFQAGMDYWANSTTTDPANIKEAFYSQWYGDTGGEYITIKYPDYDAIPQFDRSDYGFTQNGKFYLSKRLVDHVGATSVALMHNATGWEPANMTLNGDFYEYQAYSNYYGFETYCFKANPSGNSFFIPHAVIDMLKYPEDAIPNGYGGYNFYTTPVAQLSAPANLAATYQTDANSIVLNWNYVADATGYKVFWSNSPGVSTASSLLVTTSTTQYTITDVNIGSCYFFKVQAINAHGQSPLSSEAHACAESNVPATPENLSVAYGSSQNANFLTWDAVEGATEYRLYWGTSSGVTNTSNLLVTSNTEFTHSGMVVGNCYFYRISAANNDGESDLSPEVFACAEPNIPDTPQNFSVVYQPSENSNLLTWDGVDGATSYKIYWGTSTGVSNTSNLLTTSNTEFLHSGLAEGSCYFYRISAYNEYGESDLSSEVFACAENNNPPPAPQNFVVVYQPDENSNLLSWDSVDEATQYRIYWGNESGITTSSNLLTTTNNEFLHSGLVEGSCYFYRISAYNEHGESDLSSEIFACAENNDPPSTPQNFVVVYQPNENSNLLSWDAVDVATQYRIYWGNESGVSTNSNLLTTTSNEFLHTGLVEGSCYFYRISASNQHGESDLSSEVFACAENNDPPPTPQNFEVVYQPNENSNLLSWDAVDVATQYRIYWGNEPGINSSSNHLTTNNSSYLHSNLESGTCYYYRLVAVNSNGESPLTNEKFSCTQLQTPSISGLYNFPDEGLVLTWVDVNGADFYRVYFSHYPGVSFNSEVIQQTNETRFVIPDPQPATRYFFRVSAVNEHWESDLSQEVSTTYHLNKPSDVSVVYDSLLNANILSWSHSVNAQYYKIYSKVLPDVDTYFLLATTTNNQLIDESVIAGKCHYYKLKAHSDAWDYNFESIFSDEVFECIPDDDDDDEILFDRSDYGVFKDGKYFLSKRLIDFVNGNQVAVLSNSTGWQPLAMTLVGEMYEVKIGGVYYTSKHLYCFKINNEFFVPHAVIDNLKYPEDAVDNDQGGFNFFTDPIIPLSSERLINSSRIRIFPNPASNFVKIEMDNYSENNFMVSIIDVLGRREDFSFNGSSNIVNLEKFSNGLYVISISSEGRIISSRILMIHR